MLLYDEYWFGPGRQWGYRRIVSELKNLGIRIVSSTVKKVLKDSGVHPALDKGFKKSTVP